MKNLKSISLKYIFTGAALLFLFVQNVNAAIFYISTTGNDITGNGTISNPWKTLYKATSTVVNANDIIRVNAGVYTETMQCFLAPGVSIEGDGVTSVLKSTLTADFIPLLSAISPEGTNGNQHISNLKFDGQNLSTFWGINVAGRSNVSIHDITMVDFKDRGILFNGRNDNIDAPPSIYARGNSIYNSTILNSAAYNTPNGIYGRGAINIGGQDGMLIYNNIIIQNQRPNGFNGWPIKYLNNGYLKGVKIYNNTLTKIPSTSTFGGENGWDFAVELFNVQGLEIYNNTIQGSLDFNYQDNRGVYPYSIYIHNNTISQTGLSAFRESGIIIEFSVDGLIVENNVFKNISSGIAFYPRAGTIIKDVSVRKNLFSNIGQINNSEGYMIGGFNGALGSWAINNFEVYNNTFISATGNAAPFFAVNLTSSVSFTVNAFKFKNNIIQGLRNNAIVSNDLSKFSNSQIQYNDLFGNGDNVNIFYYQASATSLNGTNTVSNNLAVNPLFMGGENYYLQPSSPLINAGVNVGLPFTGPAPDIGYAEANIALPVKIINFSVEEKNERNILKWTTATESNSSHFNIERSSNGQDYEVIGRVTASGFSSGEINYNFTDAAPLTGINYYRLAMIDKDNSKEYSGTVSILSKSNQSLNIIAAQLSTGKKDITLKIASTENQRANIILFDQGGRVILNEAVTIQKGINTINKTTPTISKGIYYLKLFTSDATVVKNIFTTE
jgi:hypothetical protein